MSKKTKYIISIIIFFILFALSYILSSVSDESKTDEGKTSEVANNDSSLSEQTNYKNKLIYQIDYLSQTNASFESLLDRKENAAWAALALYLSGLVFLFFSFFKQQKNEDKNYCKKIIISIVLIIILIIAFAFIHAQYSSIYESYGMAYASNKLLIEIIDSGVPLNNLGTEHYKQYKIGLNIGQKYRGHLHPIQICCDFILLDWMKPGKRNLNSTNTQEASIYLIMFLFNAIIIAQIFKGGIPKT